MESGYRSRRCSQGTRPARPWSELCGQEDDIHHSAASGDIVMNARSELWERAGVSVVLPVAGVFTLRNGLITRWEDYWDSATFQPLLDTLKIS
ncbi:MAG: hypothetical protein JKX97_00405 [Candidatus Lindowbacteria bacterium]|nr:hypothetical protein [Candidatus Lindowbacteria bacterium]